MKKVAILVAVLAALVSTSAAQAKGCIKGALIGGTAGHFAGHHGFLGATAGCLIGRHEAKKHAREQQMREQRAHPETVGSRPSGIYSRLKPSPSIRGACRDS
jgi:hypothetical protein